MDLSLLVALLVGVLGSLAGILLGFLLGKIGRGHLQGQAERIAAELARSEAHSREQTRLLTRMQAEQSTVAGLIRQLPIVVRELNRSDLDPARIPHLVFGLAQDAFQPEQMLLYLVPSPGAEDEPGRELILRDHRGLGEVPPAVKRIKVGEGKIGWAAQNRVDMLGEEWFNLSRTEGHAVHGNHPTLRLDMISPLLHTDESGTHLLGVLCVGLPKTQSRTRDEKLLLQMITNLGSIALMNDRRVSELKAKANHDGLTGLLNKRHFMVELGMRIHKAEREGQPLGIFIFDIDHFKKYNDTNGHLAGDELLKTVARILRKSVRPGDLAGRYGGEEFLVAMPQADRPAAFEAAERIREAIETYPFPHGEKQPLGKLTISGGVAVFPVDGTEGSELIRGADQALYQAKSGGRNRVLAYQSAAIGDAGGDAPLPSATDERATVKQ